jgi:hypothetical protein
MFSTEPSSSWHPDFLTVFSRIFAICAIVALVIAQLTKEYLYGIIVVLIFAALSRLLRVREARTTQASTDDSANEIVNAVKEGKHPRFDLYLRPFSITNRIRMANDEYDTSLFSPNRYEQPTTVDFETTLAGATPAPLIALGRPGETAGAGRIRTNEDTWWDVFLLLAEAAERIFVIPSTKSGTQREIEWLKSRGKLGKCVFLCPPMGGRKVHIHRGAEWEATARELPIQLPPYSTSGLFFTVDDAGRLLKTAQIERRDIIAAVRAIRAVENTDSHQNAVIPTKADETIIPTFQSTGLSTKADETILPSFSSYGSTTKGKRRIVKKILWSFAILYLLGIVLSMFLETR